MKRILAVLSFLALPVFPLAAAESFTVQDIRIEGLQRIAAGTVFNYLPIKVGDTVSERDTQEALRALFKTGFFRDVRLERQGNLLIVSVVERPSIAGIRISGAKEFSDEDLKKALKEIGLAEGRVFNRSLMDRVEQEMRQQYFARGYYAVSIKPTVTPLERNRVSIQFDVTEGRPARIRQIDVVGNRAFPDKKLLDQFVLGPAPWYSFFSSADQYSKQKLTADLETLRNFYQDQGYLEFNVESTQVSITPDKENIYITINITEGGKYTFTGSKFSGTFPVPQEEIEALVTLKPGKTFSRRLLTESTKAITDRLANDGYAFANVNAIPEIDKEKAEVQFTFFVDPGKRVYVRRVNFSGNLATRDEVLRREMRQLEGGWYAADKIQRSRVRLQRLGFFEDVNVETPAVPDSPDQVDVNVAVKERHTGNLLLGVGYSDADGVLFNASVTQSNLFGTGKELTVSVDTSESTTNFNVRYTNPYYTPDGISRGFNFFRSRVDAAEANTAAYDVETTGAGVFYGIPLSELTTLNLGVNVEQITIKTGSDAAQVAQDFVTRQGNTNDLLVGTASWAKDSLDSTLLPTQGTIQRVSGELALPGSDLEYYRLNYLLSRYWPVGVRNSFRLKGEFGFGDGYGDTKELPFFKNYFAGGSSTVRGYKSRSLGPRDPRKTDDPIGGDRRLLANAELYFPVPGSSRDNKSMRMSWFVDSGAVWGPGQKAELSELRYSTGLAFNWFSPVGPLSFSLGYPLNEKANDKTEAFQFTLGVPFR
jgi:outer membrane protein insertion porin family